jgi:hypothetical protein
MTGIWIVQSHQFLCRHSPPIHLCVQAVICIAMSCWSPRACNDRIRETHQLEVFAIHGSLAGTSTLRFSLTFHAACENPTPIRLCQAHAGYRSGRLVPLYIRPVFYPTLSRRTTDSSGIPSSCKRDTSLLVLGSATGV